MIYNVEIDTSVNNTVISSSKNIDKSISVRENFSTVDEIRDADIALAFKTLKKKYNWGNYRFDMLEFEMTTSGGNDCDYDDKKDEAVMTVYADNEKSFIFLVNNYSDKYKVLSVSNPYTAKTIINNLITGNYSEAKD